MMTVDELIIQAQHTKQLLETLAKELEAEVEITIEDLDPRKPRAGTQCVRVEGENGYFTVIISGMGNPQWILSSKFEDGYLNVSGQWETFQPVSFLKDVGGVGIV